MLQHGMVVAPQLEAAEVGATILRRGGNAIDAAIAAAFVQSVVDPQMCGVGGFGMMQIALPANDIHCCLDFHGRCPSAVTPDMWERLMIRETPDGFGWELEGRINDHGHQSISVPGSLKAWWEAAERWGTMEWTDLVAPAIEQSRRGFIVRPFQYARWVQNDNKLGRTNYDEKLKLTRDGRSVYFHENGGLRTPGDVIHNDGMTRSLELIARDGADVFYKGEIGQKIVADMLENGGLITADDLASYRTRTSDPVSFDYRGLVVSAPPPPGGGVALLEVLSILSQFDLGRMEHNSAEHLAIVAEAQKRSTMDKDGHVVDPEYGTVPTERLLSWDYAEQSAASIRAGHKCEVVRVGKEPVDTTTLQVIDRSGNAVSMTHTLGAASGVIPPGLGFMLNNGMSMFDPRPGKLNSLAPGKARTSSMSPALGFVDRKPVMSIGAPGGSHIPLSISQVISNVVDFGMPILDAVIAPRMSAPTGDIELSNRIPESTSDQLMSMGYRVQRKAQSYAFAAVHAVQRQDDRLIGAADPQRDGVALKG